VRTSRSELVGTENGRIEGRDVGEGEGKSSASGQ
jgi:hypothetical protein